jgi:hypothetical protein
MPFSSRFFLFKRFDGQKDMGCVLGRKRTPREGDHVDDDSPEQKRMQLEPLEGCVGALYVCADGGFNRILIDPRGKTSVTLRNGKWTADVEGGHLVLTQASKTNDEQEQRTQREEQSRRRLQTLAALRADVAALRADAVALLDQPDDAADSVIVPTLRHQKKALAEAELAHQLKDNEPLTVTTTCETRVLALEPNILYAVWDTALIWHAAALPEPRASTRGESVRTTSTVPRENVSPDSFACMGAVRGLVVHKNVTFVLQHNNLLRIEGKEVLQKKPSRFVDGPAAIWTNGERVYVTWHDVCIFEAGTLTVKQLVLTAPGLWGAVEHDGVVYVLQAKPARVLIHDAATLAACAEPIPLPTGTEPRCIALYRGRLFVYTWKRTPQLWVYDIQTNTYSLHPIGKAARCRGLFVTYRFVVTLCPDGVEFWLHDDNYSSRYAMHRRAAATALFANEDCYFVAEDGRITKHPLPVCRGDIK